ncbi:MAG: ABC transporter substrate-binding protein [Cohaesibacteraceae bacterium]|nr:ABC transporter substrate-binding protein [Cohaesibacteraceae bacterium]MBL4875815.1 ABC transporter substrate-binding protein [Cohaesibacteraceae bacterium]
MKITTALGTLAFAAFLATNLASADELNVICSSEQDHCDLLVRTFEDKTGIDVAMVRKSTGETLAQIRAEAGNPKVDVWYGGTGDPHIIAAGEGLTRKSGVNTDDLLGWAKNMVDITDGRSIGIYAGALGIGYNSELLAQKGLKPPLCWRDLADPSYAGEIQVANPNSSGTAYTELATFVQLFGEEEGFKLLKKIGKNVNQYTKSGSAPTKAAARGETTIAISFIHGMVKQAVAGFPIVAVSPCEGTGYEVGAVSIIKGTKNFQAAQKWVEYVLTPDAQALAAQVGSFQVPSNSNSKMPPEAPDLTTIKLIDYDFATYGSSETRKRLLNRWDKDVKPASK